MRQITEFVSNLHEPYKSTGYKFIAERFANTMSLHMLYLLTMFQQNAEQERISAEERQRVIESTLPETFRILDSLHNQVSIQSIDDIGALGGIVIGLQMLSETDSAKEAQNWLYELPAMYYHQLVEENLVHKNSPKLNNI